MRGDAMNRSKEQTHSDAGRHMSKSEHDLWYSFNNLPEMKLDFSATQNKHLL